MNITIYRAAAIPPSLPEARYQLPKGFPFLIDDDELAVIEPALLYLANRFLKRKKFKRINTAEAVAYDLQEWWRFLAKEAVDQQGDESASCQQSPVLKAKHPTNNCLDWTSVDLERLKRYRDTQLVTVSLQTHQCLSPKTVGRRLSSVLDLYRWAAQNGLLERDRTANALTDPSRMTDYDFLRSGAYGEYESKEIKELLESDDLEDQERVCPLEPSDWRLLEAELGPLPSEAKKNNDSRPVRDRLAAESSLQTGLRAAEVAQLTIYQILDLRPPVDSLPQTVIPLKVTRTKGLRARMVQIPVYLVDELKAYIDGERAESLTIASKYWLKPGKRPPATLFLNGVAARNHAGHPVSAATLSRRFHEAVLRAGLIRTAEKIDPSNGEVYATHIAAHCFHDLRHTFAVWTYNAEKYAGNPEPWKILQTLLGHRHMQTTINIYLRVVSLERKAINAAVFFAVRRRYDGHQKDTPSIHVPQELVTGEDPKPRD